jgi:hypothetical protein
MGFVSPATDYVATEIKRDFILHLENQRLKRKVDELPFKYHTHGITTAVVYFSRS